MLTLLGFAVKNQQRKQTQNKNTYKTAQHKFNGISQPSAATNNNNHNNSTACNQNIL